MVIGIAYVSSNIIVGLTTPIKEEPNGENPTNSSDPNEEVNGENPTNSTDPTEKPEPIIPQLRVEGKDIVDQSDNIIKLSGFYIWNSDILYRLSEVDRNIKNIKAAGFNTILVATNWSYLIEQSEDEPGVYSNENIALIEHVVKSAQDEELYVIIGMRISASDSTSQPNNYGGWAYADMFSPHYTSNWDEYFSRYLKAWEFIIQRLDKFEAVIGYNLWFYPFHGMDPETGKWTQPTHKIDHYEKVLTPRLLSMLRSNSEKIYFWTPVDQGSMMTPEISQITEIGYEMGEIINDPLSSTGQYLPGFNRTSEIHLQYVNRELMPLNDTNVIYCAEGHRPLNVERLEQSPLNWTGSEYQKKFIEASFNPLYQFKEKYQVPVMITEMGMINQWWGVQRWRIVAYDYKMQLLNNYGINWVYMWNGREHPVNREGDWNNIGKMLIRNIPE
jgi:hypothetical protein